MLEGVGGKWDGGGWEGVQHDFHILTPRWRKNRAYCRKSYLTKSGVAAGAGWGEGIYIHMTGDQRKLRRIKRLISPDARCK